MSPSSDRYYGLVLNWRSWYGWYSMWDCSDRPERPGRPYPAIFDGDFVQ